MAKQEPREKPILERLIRYIPGYGGYLERGNRRAADRALRDAVASRLNAATAGVDRAIRNAIDQRALDRVAKLEQSRQKLDRLGEKLRAGGSGTDSFYKAPLDEAKANPIYNFDLAIYERADALAKAIDHPETLDRLEAEVAAIEDAIDQRTLLLQGIH